MQITIDIPEWAQERIIYVIAGLELLASKEPGKPLMIKNKRCVRCGKCCMNVPKNHTMGINENGDCAQLEYDKKIGKYTCGMKYYKPLPCCIGHGNPSYCSATMEEAK